MEDKRMSKGRIILLNGVSSSGKSTLSKELVKRLPGYFHLSIDDFDLVIERMEDRDNERLIPVATEYFFHRTIAMFSDKGINLVVDQILHDHETTKDCLETLKEYPVFIVGVHCPEAELERREQARGDRSIGQAKKQLDYVHQQNEVYDIEVDTFHQGIESSVEAIIEKLLLADESEGWQATIKKYNTNLIS
jgi:chloramphenicol 3-O phosphotransferase